MRRFAYFFKLGFNGKPCRVSFVNAVFVLVPQACHAHHKKLIKVRCGNGNKFQAFQKRRGFYAGFAQHAQVKF